MLAMIESINSAVNNFIWGVPAMICIIGVGLYLSIRTNFLQIRKFPYAMKITLGRMLKKREASDGALTPFQAVCTALAATVGTGNVAGVAGAIAIGGPGAIFWMWISALLGMCTIYWLYAIVSLFGNEIIGFIVCTAYVVLGLPVKFPVFYCAGFMYRRGTIGMAIAMAGIVLAFTLIAGTKKINRMDIFSE